MDTSGSPQTAAQFVKQTSKHRKAMRQVLTELAMFIDAGNNCPSHKDIANETGLSMTTVRHSLTKLEKDGTIAITKKGGAKVQGGKKDCYDITGFTPVKPAPESVSLKTVVPITTVINTAQMSTTVTSDTVKHETAASHVHAGSDAAGEKDLSEKLSAKEKDKKPLSPSKTGDSQVSPQKPIRPPKPRNPLFDAITQHIFGITLDNAALVQANAPRVGKMLASFPADKDTLTGERIAHFGRWWAANKKTPDGKPLNKPLTAEKLATHWSDFEKANPVQSVQSREAAAQRQEENRAQLEQESRRIQREMLGMSV